MPASCWVALGTSSRQSLLWTREVNQGVALRPLTCLIWSHVTREQPCVSPVPVMLHLRLTFDPDITVTRGGDWTRCIPAVTVSTEISLLLRFTQLQMQMPQSRFLLFPFIWTKVIIFVLYFKNLCNDCDGERRWLKSNCTVLCFCNNCPC